MKLQQGILLLTSLFASSAIAATSRWSGDWFEIEVILVSQLNDKSSINEVFDPNATLPAYRRSVDLLSSYLQPDIYSLKKLMPQCSASEATLAQENKTYLERATVWPKLHTSLSLTQIDEQPIDEELALRFEQEQVLTYNNDLLINQLESTNIDDSSQITAVRHSSDDFFDRVQTAQEQNSQSSNDKTDNESEQSDSLTAQPQVVDPALSNTDESEIFAVNEVVFSEEQLAEQLAEHQLILAQAEAEFAENLWPYQSIQQPFPQQLCVLSQAEFEQLALDKNYYSYLGFPIDKAPTIISSSEDLYNPNSYLINKDSFQLRDVYTQLKRSRNFRPILHLGWRQQVFEENKSTPVKLYAGDNLQHHFQQELLQYQSDKAQALADELALLKAINQVNNQDLQSSEPSMSSEELISLAKRERIKNIVNHLNLIEQTSDIESLNQVAQPITINNEQNILEQPPQAPIQPWFMEGFLNVYLIGNFLNVKTDFNMVNLTLAEQASAKLKPDHQMDLFPINLSQKRRMISRETHYFDHPYMGVIIQIRRHDKPEIEAELSPEEQGTE